MKQLLVAMLGYLTLIGTLIMIVIVFGITLGCGASPAGPPPPVIHADTFEEHIAMMKTPGYTATWLDEFSKYSDPYTGWFAPEGMDLSYSLAHDLWKNYINGFSRGKCGSFAAMQAVCSREHGYEAGIIVWWAWDDNKENVIGHAEAWVKEEDGISIQSNLSYDKEIYMDYEDMLEDYKQMHVHEHGYLLMYDAYWNEDTRKEYTWK